MDVLKQADEEGFHPTIPPFGFGDPTSVKLIADVVIELEGCGAVRHGAECFNYYFPQELDDEFLVIWDGFPEIPWQPMSDPQLRAWFMERIKEG